MSDEGIGRRVAAQRRKLGISQPVLAQMMEDAGRRAWHATIVGRIENNQMRLRASEVVTLSKILDIEVLELLTGYKDPAHSRGYDEATNWAEIVLNQAKSKIMTTRDERLQE